VTIFTFFKQTRLFKWVSFTPIFGDEVNGIKVFSKEVITKKYFWRNGKN